jgi:hypothetical protein
VKKGNERMGENTGSKKGKFAESWYCRGSEEKNTFKFPGLPRHKLGKLLCFFVVIQLPT